jgi:hypothetical protein
MTIKNFIPLFLSGFLFMAMSCKKRSTDTTQSPLIVIAEPGIGDTIDVSVDPELHIEFTASSNKGLHALKVALVRNNTDTLLHESPAVMDLKAYPYHEHVLLSATVSVQSYQLYIRAEDHDGASKEELITVYAQP